MRFVSLVMLFATWLLVSAFALPQTASSAVATGVAAVLVAVLALAAHGKPAARYGISAVAVALAALALFTPGLPGLAAVSDALVAAVLFALSLVRPGRSSAPASHAT